MHPKSGKWAVPVEDGERNTFLNSGMCVITTAEEFGIFSAYLPISVSLLGVERVESTQMFLRDSSGGSHAVDVAPMLCLALITADSGYLIKLERARQLIVSWTGIEIAAPVFVSVSEGQGQLAQVLISSVTERLQEYATQVGRLSRELFRLRAEHENTLNAFATLESFVAQSNIQPCNLTFDNLPSGTEAVLAFEVAAIGQILPVSTFGLSVLQLHVADWSFAEFPVGGLSVELRSVEDREILGTWEIPHDELTPGWLTLSLNAGLTGLQRTPEMLLSALGGFGVVPPVSLGDHQPLHRFRVYRIDATGSHVEFAERSLALRTWSGLPGVRPPGVQRDFKVRQEARHSEVRDIVVPFTLIRGIEETLSNWAPGFSPVEYIPDLRGFLCHPPPSDCTWAVMPLFPTSDQPFRVSARAEIRNSQSLPVDFGLVLASWEPERVRQEILANAEARSEDGFVFSGWRSAAYGDVARPSMLVVSDMRSPTSLYFVTRMSNGQSNAFAWACFYDVRKTLLGVSSQAQQYAPNVGVPVAAYQSGEPLPVIALKAVEHALVQTKSQPPTVSYDDDRQGIFCHPPPSGITLGKLPQIGSGTPFRFFATAHITSEKSESVDCCICVSSLDSAEVLKYLESVDIVRTDAFASTGWRTIRYGRDTLLEIDTLGLLGSEIDVYVATRMSVNSTSNNFAWAYFLNLRILDIRVTNAQHLATI